jgi:hypothetical protein
MKNYVRTLYGHDYEPVVQMLNTAGCVVAWGIMPKGKILLSILMASVVCLHFGRQEEDIIKHTNDKGHLCTL